MRAPNACGDALNIGVYLELEAPGGGAEAREGCRQDLMGLPPVLESSLWNCGKGGLEKGKEARGKALSNREQ